MLMVRVLPGASNKFRTGNKLIPARDRARVARARATEHIHKWHLMNNTTIIKPRSSGSVMEIPSNAFSSVDIAKAAIKKLSDFLASKAGSHLVERRVRRAMSLPSLPSSIELKSECSLPTTSGAIDTVAYSVTLSFTILPSQSYSLKPDTAGTESASPSRSYKRKHEPFPEEDMLPILH